MLSTNGSFASCLPPASISPASFRLVIARQAWMPPRAATFFSTICVAVSPLAGAVSAANADAQNQVRKQTE